MKNVVLLVMSALLVFTGCKKDVKEKDLEGIWIEKPITTKFAGTRHWVQFNSDMTFHLKIEYFTDMVSPDPVPCPGNRTEYIMGNYHITDKTITFTGNYCDASFTQYTSNCAGTESFEEKYSTTFKGKDLVLDYEKEDPYKIWLVKQ